MKISAFLFGYNQNTEYFYFNIKTKRSMRKLLVIAVLLLSVGVMAQTKKAEAKTTKTEKAEAKPDKTGVEDKVYEYVIYNEEKVAAYKEPKKALHIVDSLGTIKALLKTVMDNTAREARLRQAINEWAGAK